MNADFLLRNRNREPRLPERGVDGDPELTLDHEVPVESIRPRPELKLERAVAEAQEQRQRSRSRDDVGMALGHLGEPLQHLVRSAPVGDVDWNVETTPIIRRRPVRDALSHELRVRHDDLRALPCAHRGGPDADPSHLALNLADLDGVAHAHRSLEEQYQARNEVVDDVLQAEADADAEGAAEHRDPIEIDAQSKEGQDEPDRDDRVLDEAG